MKKEKYYTPVVEILRFECEDIVTSSGGFDGEVDEFSEYSDAEAYDNW